MSKVKLYNQEGKEVKDVQLNPAIFEVAINVDTIHQVAIALQANKRQNLAHAKTRAEVRGGGKKPWRQKGTGRARHGSSRSPIWIGGGVTFGPSKDRNFSQKINKKMRRKALFMVLSERVKHDNLKLVESLFFEEFKTKEVVNLLKNLQLEKSVLLVVDKMNKQTVKSVINIPKVDVIEARNLNLLELLKYKNLLVSLESVKVIEKVFLTNDIEREKVDMKVETKKVITKV